MTPDYYFDLKIYFKKSPTHLRVKSNTQLIEQLKSEPTLKIQFQVDQAH